MGRVLETEGTATRKVKEGMKTTVLGNFKYDYSI